MDRIIAALIITLSLLAIGNSVLIYKRSFYLEAPNRVNLESVIENVDDMEHPKLIELSKRLVSISDSEFQILLLMSEQFRRAIAWLAICLVMAIAYILYFLLQPFFNR